jgi:hypothetical protein
MTKILNIFYRLRLKVHTVPKNGSASVFGWNGKDLIRWDLYEERVSVSALRLLFLCPPEGAEISRV